METSHILFENSRTGNLTCSFEGKYLHSKYNPLVEGERFALSLQADFSPLTVIIIEPALSYCAPFIRKRFPDARICAIRFFDDFTESDSLWDFVFYASKINDGESSSLAEELYSALGEENLCSCLAFDWNPSKTIFPDKSISAWSAIKKAILKSRDILGTRAYFSKRWLKNTLIFASRIQNTATLKKMNVPIVITASGPSLASSIPFLKKNRDLFFLIAVSSSVMPLVHSGIQPDIVMSSDGGYWAKKHLEVKNLAKETVFALEAEAAVPKKLFDTKTILPLCYSDGNGKPILEAVGCPFMLSNRNGTVAGTAMDFALNLTSKSVYFCGLDQAPAAGFQHTLPNALENDSAKKDFRLRNIETRQAASRFSSGGALEIYRNWFISNSGMLSKRVFRLSDSFSYDYPLGQIQDIGWGDFEAREKQTVKDRSIFFEMHGKVSSKERTKKVKEAFRKCLESEQFCSEIFPMESLIIRRELSEEKKLDLISGLEEKKTALQTDCEKCIR